MNMIWRLTTLVTILCCMGVTAASADSARSRDTSRLVLVSPTPIAPQADEPLRTYRFTWRGVAGAAWYRVEIARDASFRELLYAEESSTTTLTHGNRTLPLGTIYWRVTAMGEAGQSGPPSAPVPIRVVP